MQKDTHQPPKDHGHFLDGERPVRQRILVKISAGCVTFKSLLDSRIYSWPFKDIHCSNAKAKSGVIRLGTRTNEDAALVITDAAITQKMRQLRLPFLRHIPFYKHKDFRPLAMTFGGVMATILALWFFWPPIADVIALSIPASVETNVGKQALLQMSPHGNDSLCHGSEGQIALNKLKNRLLGPEGNNVQLMVVRQDIVNAFAAPGNQIFIFSALIDQATDGDQLAGVLAHELGHLRSRHVMRGLVRAMGVSFLIQTLTRGDNTANIGATLLNLSYSREFESEADQKGIVMLTDNGISPTGYADFFSAIEKEEASSTGMLRYISTHPPSAERESIARQAALKNSHPALSAQEWLAIRAMCKPIEPLRLPAK